MKRKLKMLRIFQIITVLLCVLSIIILFWFEERTLLYSIINYMFTTSMIIVLHYSLSINDEIINKCK